MQRSSALLAARVAATSSLLREPKETIAFAQTVSQYDAAGLDVASTSTTEFLKLQSALIPYRIVKFNEELKVARELGFGSLPAGRNLFIRLAYLAAFYYAGYVFGLGSFVAPSRPPMTEAEKEELNAAFQAKQAAIVKAQAVAEEKRLARLEKEKEKEEKAKVALEAAIAAAEERRRQKALARERGY